MLGAGMGVTYKRGVVRSNGHQAEVEFLVDSGAQYTLLTRDVWRRLHLQRKRTQGFTLGDGSHIERGIGECEIVLDEGAGHTPVILGEPGDDQPLLGVVTLEEFGLVLNPISRQLYRAPLLPLM